MKAVGLTPVFADETTYFAEADSVFICRKLYSGVLTGDSFADSKLIDFNYPNWDFHTMYVGEIPKVLINNSKHLQIKIEHCHKRCKHHG